jgi:hypothetical protein
LWRGSEQAKAADSKTPPERFCDLCGMRAKLLPDRSIPCGTPSCKETFTWTQLAQLEAILAHTGEGSPPPPTHLCDACREKAAALGDRQLPCSITGCTRTWRWTGREQLAASEPPARMCDTCTSRAADYRDQKVPCRVRGCRRSWIWTKQARLEAAAADPPIARPDKMCEPCEQALAAIVDQEIACKVEGCTHKWTWRRMHQLEAQHAGEQGPPARMCAACQTALGKFRDLDMPCKRSGCKGTWLFRRGAQHERWIKSGQPEDPLSLPAPQRLCDDCRRGLGELSDREVACRNEGCDKTWTWTRFAQLAAREQGHGSKPPSHMCDRCKTFLTDRKTKTIVCSGCSAEIHWAPELQLKTELGLMQEPTLCGACKQKAARSAPRRVIPSTN